MVASLVILRSFLLSNGLILYVSSASTTEAQCSVGQTSCDDGSCYYSVGRCDGIPDCNDGSDEANCQTNTLPPQCPEQQQRCPDGSCINPHDNCTAQTASTMAGGTVTSSITTGDTFTTSSVALMPSVNETLPPWSIALIVILVFVAVWVLFAVLCVRKKKQTEKVGNFNEDMKLGSS